MQLYLITINFLFFRYEGATSYLIFNGSEFCPYSIAVLYFNRCGIYTSDTSCLDSSFIFARTANGGKRLGQDEFQANTATPFPVSNLPFGYSSGSISSPSILGNRSFSSIEPRTYCSFSHFRRLCLSYWRTFNVRRLPQTSGSAGG